MKKLLSAFLLALFIGPISTAQPPGNKNQFIELPADMEISSKQRSVKITAKTEATDPIHWLVIGTAPGLDVQWDDVGSKSIRLYPNDADEDILVIAYTTIAMKATPPVSMVIKVYTGQKPDPGKPDPGKPDPPGKPPVDPPDPGGPKSGRIAAHCSFIVDNAKMTADIAAILNDAQLRKFIADNGIRLHSPIDIRSETVTRPKGFSGVVAVLGGPPVVVVQDSTGAIIGQGKMTSAAQVRSVILPHTR